MKVIKKKKGSTFVIVIVVMAIIFTTGTTILAVTANDYKMRINQSKKLQNLYEADSGLDIVENIIIKTSQEAIKYADKEVKKEFVNLEGKDNRETYINNYFKSKFYEFFETRKIADKKVLEYLILNKEIIKSVNSDGNFILEEVGKNKNFKIEIVSRDGQYGYKENKNENITQNISIDIQSTFESTDGQVKNQKIVATNYQIIAPDYNSKITSINISPVFDGKAITADGNMDIINTNVNIQGDIWIQGNNELGENPEYIFDKYIGGIKLDNTNFNIDGNIYTNNTLHLNNKVKSNVNGETFAKNVYVGKSANSNISSLNEIIFEKNIIVNNDLALNATNSNIVIKNNFYGINEKTTDIETANKALNSSSIIVNDTSKTSTLTVEKNSYIMGVAYLNAIDETGQKYQTGESVAIKGNYLAYTDVKDILNGANNVTLKYYSPLQLLESKNGDSSANMKADYLSEYYYQNKNYYKFNEGGVELKGNVKSVGTSIKDSNGNIKKSNIIKEDIDLINIQRNEFARNVFAMGDATGYENLYNGQEVMRTVNNQIDFTKVKDENIINENGVVILRGTKNSHINIVNGFLGEDKIEKGLIITNGDITIKGEFNFRGNIITTGNIVIEGDGEKNITYDPQVIRDILSLNSNLLKDIFVKSSNNREEVRVELTSELYSVDKFLKKSLWKVVK